MQFKLEPASREQEEKLAERHLVQAITHLERALQLEPSLLAARMGLAWCLDQAGKKERALKLYKEVFKTAYENESKTHGDGHGLEGFSLTVECGQDLCSLLNPVKDASELAEIQSQMKEVGKYFRAVTPLIIPLTQESEMQSLLGPAHLQFDLDGQGKSIVSHGLRPKLVGLCLTKLVETRLTRD